MNIDMSIKKNLLWIGLALYLVTGIYLVTTTHDENKKRREHHLVLAVPGGVVTSPIYRRAVERFEALNPDISVDLLEISGSFYQKVTMMIAGKIAPDLMWMGQSFSEFADRGVFLDITERIEREIDTGQYNSEVLSLYQRNDRYYGIPYGIDTRILIYNRELFREKGLAFPADNWDFRYFLKCAKALTEIDESGRKKCFGYSIGLPFEIFGARLFDPETGLSDCNTPEMIDYFKTNLFLTNEAKVIPNAVDQSQMNSDTASLFRQRRIAMMECSTMQLARTADLLGDMDWAMTLFPKVKNQRSWASSQAICIYRHTKEPEAAWKLFKFFLEKEFQLDMAGRCLPARKDYAEEFIDSSSDGDTHNFAILKKLLGLLQPTARVPNLQEYVAVFARFTNRIFVGKLSPETGMEKCEKEINNRIETVRAVTGS